MTHSVHYQSIQGCLPLLVRGPAKAHCQITLHLLTGAAALHVTLAFLTGPLGII